MDSYKIIVNARFLTQKTTGVQRYAIELSKRLKAIDSNIVFVAPRNIIHGALAVELGVQTFGKMTGHLWEKVELPYYLLKKGSPILINLCNTGPFFYINQIVAIHDAAIYANSRWFTSKFSFFYKLSFRILSRFSKRIITVSEFSKKEIIHYLSVPESKIQVIYNGTEHLLNIDSSCESVTKEDYLLCVGSIDPRKNLSVVLEGFKILSKNYNNLKLKIAGGSNNLFRTPFYSHLNLSELESKIEFLGYVTDEELANLYANAKAFLFPSLYEGFGIPPLEAMSLNCPVIVSNCASLPEVCGTAALFFDPLDSHSLVSQVCLMLESPELQSNLRILGRKQIDNFTWSESTKKLYLIIRDTI